MFFLLNGKKNMIAVIAVKIQSFTEQQAGTTKERITLKKTPEMAKNTEKMKQIIK